MSDVNMEQIPGLTKTVGYVMYLKAQNDKLQREADQLRAELEAIRGQQAVAWASPDAVGGVRWSPGALQQLSDGSPLYALPPQQPDAVSVPRELLERLAKKAEVFDDGSDGADAESARSVAETLRALLSTKNAEEV